jgi:hypothetical protein
VTTNFSVFFLEPAPKCVSFSSEEQQMNYKTESSRRRIKTESYEQATENQDQKTVHYPTARYYDLMKTSTSDIFCWKINSRDTNALLIL